MGMTGIAICFNDDYNVSRKVGCLADPIDSEDRTDAKPDVTFHGFLVSGGLRAVAPFLRATPSWPWLP